MQNLIFSLVVLCLYFGALYGFKFWLSRQSEERLRYALEPAVAAFITGAIVLGGAACSVIYGAPEMRGYVLGILSLLAVLFLTAKAPELKAKFVWMPLMCVVGTFVLNQIFPALFENIWMFGLQVLVWLLVMTIITFFDNLPLMLFLTAGSWTLAFIVSFVGNIAIPAQLVVLVTLLFAPMWGVMNVLSYKMHPNYGPFASHLIGFVMGGIVAACVGLGAYTSATALMSYYLFELIFFAITSVRLKPFGIQEGYFAYSLIFNQKNPAYLVKSLFYHLVILALLATLMWKTQNVTILLITVFVVCLDLYSRFRAGKPAPTIKEMLKETKETVALAVKNLKTENKNLQEESVKETQEEPEQTAIKKAKASLKKKNITKGNKRKR